MGDCASIQEISPPTRQIFQTGNQILQFNQNLSVRKTNCKGPSLNQGYQQLPQHPPGLTDFSIQILQTVLKQHIRPETIEKQAIFRNITKLDFNISTWFGGIKIINSQVCIPLLQKDGQPLIVTTNFGHGRTLVISHQEIYSKFIALNKDWIIFYRNIIQWITKNKPSLPQNRIKILMTSSRVEPILVSSLQKVSTFISITYEEDLHEINLSNYDCLFLYMLSKKYASTNVCQKIIKFVKDGGGLLVGFRGWNYQCYDQGAKYQDWPSQCYHNQILSHMGLTLTPQIIVFNQVELTPKQSVQLIEPAPKAYTKQINPDFIEIYDTPQSDLLKQDRKFLMQGVQQCDFEHQCVSSYSYFSKNYIPLLKENDKEFCVIGRVGQGKIFLFGHYYLFQELFCRNFQKRLLQNTIKWMCGQKNVIIGLLYSKGHWCKLWNAKFSLDELEMNITTKYVDKIEQMQGVDILCSTYYEAYPEIMTDQFITKVKQWVEKGGNYIMGCEGWAWEDHGQKKNNKSLIYEKNFANYVLLQKFGVRLNNDWQHLPKNFDPHLNITDRIDKKIYNFLQNDLLSVLQSKQNKEFSSSTEQIKKIRQKLDSASPSQFHLFFSIEQYHQLVDAFIDSRFNIQKCYDQIPMQTTIYSQVHNLMNSISYICPPHICRALPPSINKYPGQATNKLKLKTVEVYKNRNAWVFTGLYINPGQVIRIKHHHNYEDLNGVILRINFNINLTGWSNGNLKRFIGIQRRIKIKSNEFTLASPHGGIIFFQIQSKSSNSKPLIFTFEGAYEAPYWNENFHSQEDFQKIKKIDAPYFIIQTKRINLIGPTKKVFSHMNVKLDQVCKFWNTVVGHIKDYRGIEQYPFQKQSIFNDVNIMMGYQHSGNPVMTYDDITFQMIGVGQTFRNPPPYGIRSVYHQFGHNHQDYKWTVDQTTEITCNIFRIYLLKKMHGLTMQQQIFNADQLLKILKKYIYKKNPKMKDYDQTPHVAMCFYAILMDDFGIDFFSKVHKMYEGIKIQDQTYQGKFDMLVQQTSRASGHNLWDFFWRYGMPVREASKLKVAGFKKYQCKRYPFITSDKFNEEAKIYLDGDEASLDN